jgi:hypothetical protein
MTSVWFSNHHILIDYVLHDIFAVILVAFQCSLVASFGDVLTALRRTVEHWINLIDGGQVLRPNLYSARKIFSMTQIFDGMVLVTVLIIKIGTLGVHVSAQRNCIVLWKIFHAQLLSKHLYFEVTIQPAAGY